MMTPTPMVRMTAVVLEQYRQQVSKALLSLGILDMLHVKSLPDVETAHLDDLPQEDTTEQLHYLRSQLEGYFHIAGIDPYEIQFGDISSIQPVDPDDVKQQLKELSGKTGSIRSRQRSLQDALLRLEEIDRHVHKSRKQVHSLSSYIVYREGSPSKTQRERFTQAINGYPSLYIQGEKTDQLISLRRDDDAVVHLLDRYGWEDAPSGTSAADIPIGAHLSQRQESLKAEQQSLADELTSYITDQQQQLLHLWLQIRIQELTGEMARYSSRTDRTWLFSGWIPKHMQQQADQLLHEKTDGSCWAEWHEPSQTQKAEPAPVELNQPAFLMPFQALVRQYGLPAYGTIDPTPLVAVFYLMMFALMFADAGHGLVLLIAGYIGSRHRKGFLYPLIQWCGLSAVVTGVLFGSYFGYPLIPPIWFDYHGVVEGHAAAGSIRTIYDILRITIYFGIFVISVGLMLNWINRIKHGDWKHLVWGAGGLLTGWIYAAGTYGAFYAVERGFQELPGGLYLPFGLLLPALLVGAKPFVLGKGRHGVMDVLLEWFVELLEIFSGYLSNTLSFMRVAGLGIAHVSLMTAFFQIADMVPSIIGAAIVLILGNILVIVLEGLSAGIQSLRLNYYEFFSKYFIGTGTAYAPISLRRAGSAQDISKKKEINL